MASIMKQIQAVNGAKNIDDVLTYEEFKRPTMAENQTCTMLTEEQKEEIRNRTRNFGKGGS